MCLLFFKSNSNAASDEYSLILVNVRDEDYSRPTKQCSDWTEAGVFGPKDLIQGGTWLAMNKYNGKIGVLLNILQPKDEISHTALSRGKIVTDYVTADADAESFLERISQKMALYNGFIMVSLEPVQPSGYDAYMLCSASEKPLERLPSGLHVVGNSDDPHRPWNKVRYGSVKFEEVLSRHPTIETKEDLIEDILAMLTDRKRCGLDENILRQGKGMPSDFLHGVNALYVEVPECKYGTRTHTVILVDVNGNVDYIEKTMKEPIYCDSEKTYATWVVNRHSFKIR